MARSWQAAAIWPGQLSGCRNSAGLSIIQMVVLYKTTKVGGYLAGMGMCYQVSPRGAESRRQREDRRREESHQNE